MVKLLNIDFVEYMKTLPDLSFDLAIVDPPYGLNIAANGKLHNNSKYDRGFRKNKEYKPVGWDAATPDAEYFKELSRVSKKQIIFGGNFFFDHLSSTRSFIIWYKKGKDTNPNFSPAEFAWTNCEGLPKVYFVDWIGFGYINSNEEKIHPCQKPKMLYKYIFDDYVKPGMKVLDTHLGSMNIAIVANAMNVDFVGCEVDKEIYERGLENYRKHTDLGLFQTPPQSGDGSVGKKNLLF